MATPVIMPRQGQSVESCLIGKWHKQVGDTVAVGDILFTYETDKATFDEMAKEAGKLLAIFFAEGDDVPCLLNVCVIGQDGESTAAFDPNPSSPDASASMSTAAIATATATPASPANPTIATAAPATATAMPAVGGALPDKISPRARVLAEKSGADLRQAQASGPYGRVLTRDVEDLIAAGKMATGAVGTAYALDVPGTGIGGRVSVADLQQAAASDTSAASARSTAVAPAAMVFTDETRTEKHSNIRKVIARSMHASIAQMAQLTLNTSFDATDMLALRAKLKKSADKGLSADQGFELVTSVPTINDLILYAVSRVLERHPACNAHYDDEKMTYFQRVHLGVAVDTPRGLMVPTIFAADQMDLATLGRSIKAASAACQTGTINPDQLKGGTFTVTNLGSLGIESFTPVINPPQTCILGVNTIVTRVRDMGGEAKPYAAIPLSLTFDHRALDGAPAARFLQDLVKALENISLTLMHG
ncbi:MAG: dihydrolipoamide acetyltransferase family protein [Eubacteriales bacterium]|nr:dihydrolipoamide acetyltransferase family protein [Eubacteriales bacterium]